MESIYYVLSFACHRKCAHCYEDRFRPYRRDELARLTAAAQRNFPRIIVNLPDDMRYLDRGADASGEQPDWRIGRIIVSGGEVLIDPVREAILYPALSLLRAKYAGAGGVRLVVQTTGDLLTERIIAELLRLGVHAVSVAGMDDFHSGMEGTKGERLKAKLTAWFEAAGMKPQSSRPGGRRLVEEAGPLYSFFGATRDSWIGKLWPRGRAWTNGLSIAGLEDNFCNRWSGGVNFLDYRHAGSEVAIEPTGDVYPCCLKTRHPLGNLTEERLTDILDSLAHDAAFAAINRGEPQLMGLAHGWSVERFLERSERLNPKGEPYRNLCLGCDAFHEEVLGPVLARLRASRIARRAALAG